MTEYRIDFDESELTSVKIPDNILSILRRKGDVRKVIAGTTYYFSTNSNMEGIMDLVTAHRGVSISKLQGEMLK